MEFKRIINKKYLALVLLVILVNLILFIFQATAGGNIAKTDDSVRQIRKQEKYIQNYSSDIAAIIEKADKLKKNRLFANKNSYSYKNIVKTGKDYEQLLNIELCMDNSKAVKAVSQYSYYLIFSIILTIIMMNSVYMERDNNMWQLTYISRNGRLRLAVTRVMNICIVSFIQHLILYATVVFAAFTIFGGIEDVLNPIQNISDFGLCTLVINKAEYLILSCLWSYLGVMVISAVVYLLLTFFRNRKNVFIGIAFFAIVEYLLYINIEPHSVYRVFKYINVVNIFNINSICMNYMNINVFNNAVNLRTLIIIVFAAIIVISLSLSVVVYFKMRPNRAKGLGTIIFGWLNVCYQKCLNRYFNLFKEIHKVLFTARGVWLILAVMLAGMYFCSYGTMTFSDVEQANDKLYKEHGGKEYSYINNYVNAVISNIEAVSEDIDNVQEKYDNGEISFKEYYAALSNYEHVSGAYTEIREPKNKLLYLSELENRTGIHGYIMSDRGYEQIFGSDGNLREIILMLVMLGAVVLLAFASVYIERKSSMDMLINSSLKGQHFVRRQKLFAGILLTIFICLMVSIIEYTYLIKFYEVTYFEAPVQSLTFMSDISLHVSIMEWMLLIVAGKVLISIIVYAISYIMAQIYTRYRVLNR